MSQAQTGPSKQSHTDSYICQRCHQPLLLDPSIQDLSSSQYNLITSALPNPSPASTLPAPSKLNLLPPSSKPGAKVWSEANSIPLTSNPRNVAESFILLSESSLLPPHPAFSSSNSTPNTATNKPIPPITGKNENLVNQLHSILSNNTPISHPLCTECTSLLTGEFQKLAEELTKERDAYIKFEKEIQNNREKQNASSATSSSSSSRIKSKVDKKKGQDDEIQDKILGEYDIEGDDEEWNELIKRKQELEDEEEQLRLILEGKERELEVVKAEEEKVKKDEEEMEREETEYLLQHVSLSTDLSRLNAALSTAQTHLLLSRSLLSHLESTNVYNDAFQIGHVPLDPSSGSGITVGTINGLRLGGRPTVEWEEINAAWGLTALCLDRIADKVGYVFTGYKIIPLGSYSRIEELPPSKGIYELYASSDLSPARLLQNRRFNYAMISILDCLKQLIEFGKKKGKGWANNNIEIHKDKISNHSIKLPGISSMPLTLPSMSIMGLGSTSTNTNTNTDANTNSNSGKSENDNSAEENWTKACRAILVVLKRILMVESQMDRSSLTAGGT